VDDEQEGEGKKKRGGGRERLQRCERATRVFISLNRDVNRAASVSMRRRWGRGKGGGEKKKEKRKEKGGGLRGSPFLYSSGDTPSFRGGTAY